jgi:hypothetical protein
MLLDERHRLRLAANAAQLLLAVRTQHTHPAWSSE